MKTTVSTRCQNQTQAHSCPARSCRMQPHPPSPAVAHTSFLLTLSAPTLWPPFFFSVVSDFCLSLGFCTCCSWVSLSPVFFMTHSFVSFRSQIRFPFSEWTSLGTSYNCSPSHLFISFRELTAVYNDFIWLFTYLILPPPSLPTPVYLRVGSSLSSPFMYSQGLAQCLTIEGT